MDFELKHQYVFFLFGVIFWGNSFSYGEEVTPSYWWTVHAQATYIPQGYGKFNASYSGPLSLNPSHQNEASKTSTLFLGARLWKDGEFYIDPEASGGAGVSAATGMAGFPNGEITRVGTREVKEYWARIFLRQTFNLSGDVEKVEDDLNQVASARSANRITITLGKFSALDIFDNNPYAGDPRSEFMNWALMANGAWDYPADTRGYTSGLAVDYRRDDWSVRGGSFMMPAVANGPVLDKDIHKAHGEVIELENRYSLAGRAGALRALSFINHADMGRYSDSLNLQPTSPDITSTRQPGRIKYGFGLNMNQSVSSDVGAFMRLGWNDGHTETFAFTEIDRTASAGLSIRGTRWHRPSDMFGIAGLVNGLSPDHRHYLAAGGLGFIIGDGQLNYKTEDIVESYYRIAIYKACAVSGDFQRVWHPGYNGDRGPVAIYAVRLHLQI